MKTVLPCLALSLLGGAASADVAPICEAPRAIDKYQLLRRLSLDLRGRIPSIDEYDSLDAQDFVPPSVVTTFLASDDFRMAMRRYHERLFWPNVSNVRLHNVNSTIVNRSPAWVLASTGRGRTFRGAIGAVCGDYEQTHFLTLPDGATNYEPDPAYVVVTGGVRDEGWRWVTPYWNPGTPIKVCAYDAMETLTVMLAGVQTSCGDYRTNGNRSCGCGPDLQFCYSAVADTTILASFREQLALSVDDVTVGGRPYTDILLSTQAHENGPISFWKRNLASNLSLTNTYVAPDPDEEIGGLDWGDASWTQVDRNGPHAGVVTLPAYLLRFQTDRGRANRFRIDFGCEFFIPPATLSPAPGCDPGAADLTQRCNCQYCHSQLEPLAAYFGLFSEAGTTVQTDQGIFPLVNPACVSPNPSAFCSRFYVTHGDAHNPGSLLTRQWVDDHPEYLDHMVGTAASPGGPRQWAQQLIDDGTFAQCAVKHMFSYLIKRDMRVAGEQSDELDLLHSLADGFRSANYSFPWLAEQVVTLPEYRRVR